MKKYIAMFMAVGLLALIIGLRGMETPDITEPTINAETRFFLKFDTTHDNIPTTQKALNKSVVLKNFITPPLVQKGDYKEGIEFNQEDNTLTIELAAFSFFDDLNSTFEDIQGFVALLEGREIDEELARKILQLVYNFEVPFTIFLGLENQTVAISRESFEASPRLKDFLKKYTVGSFELESDFDTGKLTYTIRLDRSLGELGVSFKALTALISVLKKESTLLEMAEQTPNLFFQIIPAIHFLELDEAIQQVWLQTFFDNFELSDAMYIAFIHDQGLLNNVIQDLQLYFNPQLFNRFANRVMGNQIKILRGHTNGVSSVTFSPNGKTLASGSYDDTIHLWNVETGEQKGVLRGHTSLITSIVFSPNGEILASGSHDRTIRLWNVETGEQIKVLRGHTSDVNSVAFSPDGKTLASGSEDKTIRLWNVETGEQIKVLVPRRGEWLLSVAFSPNGEILASGSNDDTVHLWNVDSGEQIKVLRGHTSDVNSVAFSPNGKILASGSYDRTIRLWNVETGEQIKVLLGHIPVLSVAFSPDGKMLASSSHDRTIRLWNVETGKQIKILQGHERTVFSVAFSPDGKMLASGSYDRTIRLWGWYFTQLGAPIALEQLTLEQAVTLQALYIMHQRGLTLSAEEIEHIKQLFSDTKRARIFFRKLKRLGWIRAQIIEEEEKEGEREEG